MYISTSSFEQNERYIVVETVGNTIYINQKATVLENKY